MNRIILILACLLPIQMCFGQTHSTNEGTFHSKDYMKIIYQHCPNPDIIEVESTSENYVEIEYLCDGKHYEIGIKNNVLMFLEHEIEPTEIPAEKINTKLEKKYSDWVLDEVSQIVTNDTSFLKVEILKEGIEKNLYFTNDGKNFKLKPVELSSTLDFNMTNNNPMFLSAKYQFNQPDSVYEMPDLLREISGVAVADGNIVYCVQDEIGSIFEYDMEKEEISNSYRFTDVGDFEDLAIDKNIIYVLRSDGNLFVYDLENKQKTFHKMIQTNSLDIEGLFFKEGYLYLASKEAQINHPETKRMVYRVEADNLENIEPYLEIDIPDLVEFLEKHYPELETSKIRFNPSAIAFHPITDETYILSSKDKFMAIYKDQELINFIPLSEDIYYQPEGLSFYANGDLLISSEGDKKGYFKATINLIKWN